MIKKCAFMLSASFLISFSSFSQEAPVPTPQLSVATFYFYNRRGLEVKELLTKSLLLDEKQGEFVSLGLDPNRDRPQQSNQNGGGGGGLIISSGVSGTEMELFQKMGGSITISASPEKVARAQDILTQMDALPWQIKIETFIIKVNHDMLQKRGVDISGVVNALQGFNPTFVDKDLPVQTLQWVFGNHLSDLGFVKIEDFESQKLIEVTKNPSQRVIHGERSTIISGERLVFSIASGLTSNIEFADVAFNVDVIPQFIPKESRALTHDAIRLAIQIEDSTPRINLKGEVDKIDRFNASTSLLVLNGQMLPLAKLNSNAGEQRATGIPLLRSIPLIGGLFGSTGTKGEKTEYLIFIRATEYSIFDQEEVQSAEEQYQHAQDLLNGKKE